MAIGAVSSANVQVVRDAPSPSENSVVAPDSNEGDNTTPPAVVEVSDAANFANALSGSEDDPSVATAASTAVNAAAIAIQRAIAENGVAALSVQANQDQASAAQALKSGDDEF